MRRGAATKILGAAAAIAVVAAAWYTLAPSQLGGRTAYAVVVGSSMEPRLHRDDLVLVRAQSRYRPGDVVLYRNRDVGRTLLHRIVRADDGRYVTKGDHNSFRDPGAAHAGDVVGAMWVRLPWVGRVWSWLRVPRNAGIVAAVAVLLLGSGTAATRVGRTRRRAGPKPRPAWRVPDGAAAEFAVGLAAAALVLFGALALWAFTHASTRAAAAHPYTQRGTFAYRAAVAASPVYPTGVVESGQTVFARLVRAVDTSFDYRFETKEPHTVHGTTALDAVLSDGSGWRRTIALQPQRPFTGDGATVAGTIRLRPLLQLVGRFERATGVHNDSYVLALVPHVRVEGAVAERRMRDVFAPALAFRLDRLRLQLDRTSPGAGAVNGLTRTRAGTIERDVPATLSLFHRHMAVATARRVAVLGGAAALAVLLLGGVGLAVLAWLRDEPARIAWRHRDLLVPTAPSSARRPRATAVDVADMQSLVRLAERYDRVILHDHHEGIHTYLVEDEGRVYRYRAQDGVRPKRAERIALPDVT